MRFILILLFIPFINFFHSKAQEVIGRVNEYNIDGKKIGLPGANIVWLNSNIGTVTDQYGSFKINQPDSTYKKIVISFTGYRNDTVLIPDKKEIEIILSEKNNIQLKEVEIIEKLQSTHLSTISSINIETITHKELQKAACCDLSESFETNASVDVSYSDAISGVKQIQLLGLAGIYTQLLTENIPSLRGLATTYGLNYIPGPWLESIQLTKGIGSVVNGFESITGQINIELKKPDCSEKIFFNYFLNHYGKMDGNLIISQKAGKNWSTMFLSHTNYLNQKTDENKDGFLDIPLVTQINVLNRWQYTGNENFKIQFGINGIYESRIGGQTVFNKLEDKGTTNAYGVTIETKRLNGFAKAVYQFQNKKTNKFEYIISGTIHEQTAFFGINQYKGIEKSFYSNFMFQSLINNTEHQLKIGGNFLYDLYNEKYNSNDFSRTDIIPGIFTELTMNKSHVTSLVTGLRVDYHTLYGFLTSPRIHFKHCFNETTTMRASAGRGFRIANIFSDNVSIFSNSRELVIKESLLPENSWNFGGSFMKSITILKKECKLSTDFFRTHFTNQTIMDIDSEKDKILFYNLDGKSYSNAFQIEGYFEINNQIEVKAAYKFQDVKATYNRTLLDKPMVNKHKALINAAFATKNEKWKFDFTTQLIGQSRLPNKEVDVDKYRTESYSPSYFQLMGRITKTFKYWEIYFGSENLTGYVQKNPIIAYDNPFGGNFDASTIWGPITGRTFYIGINIKRN